jgi:DeoR-like protein with HTH domain/DeoR sensor domain-containing protein
VTVRLFTKQRQQAIAEVIARNGQATVEGLCHEFAVSPATIRRDLDELDTQGVVIRTHGGAMRISQAVPELPVLQRGSDQGEAKRRIGKAAAASIPEGATVFIASGTTTLEIARALVSRTNLTVGACRRAGHHAGDLRWRAAAVGAIAARSPDQSSALGTAYRHRFYWSSRCQYRAWAELR